MGFVETWSNSLWYAECKHGCGIQICHGSMLYIAFRCYYVLKLFSSEKKIAIHRIIAAKSDLV